MKIVLLVGNGFDIGLGLKTKYTDFIQWYLDQDVEIADAGVENFKKRIKDDVENWSDAEMAFAHTPFKELAPKNKDFKRTGYAVDATYTTSCAPPPMMEDFGLGSVAIARPASL